MTTDISRMWVLIIIIGALLAFIFTFTMSLIKAQPNINIYKDDTLFMQTKIEKGSSITIEGACGDYTIKVE